VRRLGLTVATCVLLAAPARAEEPTPERAAFVELTPSAPQGSAEVFAGEPFTLTLRVGVDRAWFDAHALPLHARPMDLFVEVEAAGWPTLPGATRLADLPRTAEPVRFVVGGEAVEGRALEDLRRDERPFRVVEAERRFVVERPGTLELPAPTLRFAHASRFEPNAFGERVPVDRRDAVVRGTPGTLTVRALPIEGRPADFAGAIGRFTLAASVDRTEVNVNRPFVLTLVIEGSGNLASLAPPKLDAPDDFHVYGVTDDHGATKRAVSYEVAAKRVSVTAVPPIALSFFDPGPARYETVRTAPIAIAVRAGATVVDIPSPGCSPFQVRVRPWAVALTAGVILGLGFAWYRGRRRGRGSPVPPSLNRRKAALAALHAAARRPGADLAPAFAEVLAAQLDVPPAAAIGTDIAARLTESGAEPEVAERAAAVLERLVAARYGGAPAGEDARDEALALGERLAGERR
jgi:hypothetical protein